MKEHVSDMQEAVESIGPLTPKERLSLRLIYLRDDWDKNEGMREYSQPDGHAQWYLALAMNVLEAQQENFLPDSIKDKAEEYMTWWTTEYGKNHEYPIIDNPEEIGWAKDLIQSVLTSFKPDYSRKENEFNEVTLKRHLTHAKSWFDGIPTRTVHSMDGPWKVRIAWFVGIAIDFILAKEKKLISGEVINEVDKYLDWWSSLGNEEGQHITTREEIDRANKVVDRVLESLN